MIFHEFENQMYNVTCRVTWLALDNMFLRLFHAYLEDVLTIGMFLFSGKIFNGNFVTSPIPTCILIYEESLQSSCKIFWFFKRKSKPVEMMMMTCMFNVSGLLKKRKWTAGVPLLLPSKRIKFRSAVSQI